MAIGIAGGTTYQSTSGASSYTLTSYTPASGSDRILVVRVHGLRTSDVGAFTVDSVTFGGVALTQAVSEKTTSSARQYRSAIWYLINPSGSSGNIVVTFSQGAGGCIISADTLTGAAQSSPIGQTGSDSSSPSAVIANTETTDGAIGILAVTSRCNTDPTWTFVDSGSVASYVEQYDIRTDSGNSAEVSGAGASVIGPDAVTNHRVEQSQSQPQIAVLAVFKPAAAPPPIAASATDGLGLASSPATRRILRVSATETMGTAASTGRRAIMSQTGVDMIGLLATAMRARHSSHATTDAAVYIDATAMTWPLLIGDSAGLSEMLAVAAQLSASDAAGVTMAVMLTRLLSVSDAAAMGETPDARAAMRSAASDALGYVASVRTTIGTATGDTFGLMTALAARRAFVASATDATLWAHAAEGDLGSLLEALAADRLGLGATAFSGWTAQAGASDAAGLADVAAQARRLFVAISDAGRLSELTTAVKTARAAGVDAAGFAGQLRANWSIFAVDGAGLSETAAEHLAAILYALAADVVGFHEGTSTRWHVEARDTAEFVASVAGVMHWFMAVQESLGVGDMSMFVNPAGVVVIEMRINPVTAEMELRPVTIGFEIAMPRVDWRLLP